MKFLIDAQLPRRLAFALRAAGHDAVHTLDLPQGNATTDGFITNWADTQDAVIVSKDNDFYLARALTGKPLKLCSIQTGNCSNDKLLQLFMSNLPTITDALKSPACVEVGQTLLVIHP
jgi:predicted nuclease of predicted toxin-antitoxin system